MKALIQPRGQYQDGWLAVSGFRSYHIYVAVLHEQKRLNDDSFWTQELFAERLRDTLAYWRDCMAARYMNHPFLPSYNIIPDWSLGHFESNHIRLNYIIRKKAKFVKLFLH